MEFAVRLYTTLIVVGAVLYIAFPNRDMERCLLRHSYDTCHQILNR